MTESFWLGVLFAVIFFLPYNLYAWKRAEMVAILPAGVADARKVNWIMAVVSLLLSMLQ